MNIASTSATYGLTFAFIKAPFLERAATASILTACQLYIEPYLEKGSDTIGALIYNEDLDRPQEILSIISYLAGKALALWGATSALSLVFIPPLPFTACCALTLTKGIIDIALPIIFK